MTKQEALIYLNASPETWQDELENNLFELKKDLFRRVLIPKLLLKKSEKVETWYQASLVLGGETENKNVTSEIILPTVNGGEVKSILALYRAFETELMKLKLKLSQSLKAKEISILLKEIAALEFQRQEKLSPLATVLFSEEKSTFNVKLSDDNQTGIIISELKQFKKETITEKKDLFLLTYFEKDLQRILKSK